MRAGTKDDSGEYDFDFHGVRCEGFNSGRSSDCIMLRPASANGQWKKLGLPRHSVITVRGASKICEGFKGKHLFANLDAPEGDLGVEVLNEDDQVIAPFTADNGVTASRAK